MTPDFEKGSRLRLRFATSLGALSIDDLWDLPLSGSRANLDAIAIALHRQLDSTGAVSFVNEVKKDESIQLAFDIVKHVIDVRLAEKAEAKAAREKSEKKQKILGVIAKKQDESLEQMSVEDLSKLIEAL